MRPLKNKLIVKIEEAPDVKTAKSGLLFVKDDPWQVAQRGMVISKGDGVKDLEPGNIIHFPSHKGTEFRIEDDKYLIVKEEEVLAREVG